MAKKLKLYELKKIQTNFPAVKIESSHQASEFIKQFYGDDIEIFESFFLLMLNKANKTTAYAKISQGGISSTVVDVMIVAKYAVESLSAGVILCHNHPSGNMKPSQSDVDITKKIKQALALFGVQVLDHLIIAPGKYYSFADEGIL
jgi:DNA repair protein RadC